jgi:hypothetical protein
MNKKLLSSIVLFSFVLSGCGQRSYVKPAPPAKPTIQAIECNEGYVCFTKSDASSLARYVIDLEYGYE